MEMATERDMEARRLSGTVNVHKKDEMAEYCTFFAE